MVKTIALLGYLITGVWAWEFGWGVGIYEGIHPGK